MIEGFIPNFLFYSISAGLTLFLLLLLSAVWPPDSPWGPKWRTKKKVAERICKLAGVTDKDIVYELGSGDGEFTLTAAEYGVKHAIGLEIDPLRYLIASMRRLKSPYKKKVTFYRKNFKNVNMSDATIVYMYLVPQGIKRILPKFQKELKRGTVLISYRYEIPLEKKDTWIRYERCEKKSKLYFYKITS